MSATLLLTKLRRPPVPPKYVPRPLLTRRLNQGLEMERPLTLVSAPAGFGKTTCISAWLNEVALPAAWLTLDAPDDEPGRFFSYLLAALNELHSQIGQEIEAVLKAGQLPPAEVISATLINDILQLKSRFLLVLDDFQVIEDPFILGVVQTMVANWPQPLHLVILTREEPSLPLARLRANNQLSEIRAADLRFTRRETEIFLREVMGLSLSGEDLAALENKTEGWIAGLQLAALSMRERGDPARFIAELSGSHRHILRYLTEEVLYSQPPEIQSFLLRTSILDRLTGDLCDALTGDKNGRFLLERLYNDNLFLIPLDDEQQWYRYHPLFADLLRDRQRAIHAGETAALHRRASRWYEQAGLSSEAIQHALVAGDYATAVALIEAHAMDMLMAWHARTVRGWMEAIPPQWAARSPRSNMAFAWMHLFSNRFVEALPYIQRLQVMFAGDQLDQDDPALQGEWLAMQAMLLNGQGKPQHSLALAGEALALVPEENAYLRGLIYSSLANSYKMMNDYPRAVAAYEKLIEHGRESGSLVSELLGATALGLYALERGELHAAYDIAAQAAQRVERSGTLPPISAAVYGEMGSVCYQWHRLVEAHAHFARSTQVSALGGYSDAEIFHHVIRSRLAEIDGDRATAVAEMEQATGLMRADAPAAIREDVIVQQVRVALLQDQPAAAMAILRPYGYSFEPDLLLPFLQGDQVPDKASTLVALCALRILLYQAQEDGRADRLDAALALAAKLIARTEEVHAVPLTLEALLLRAQAHATRSDQALALGDVASAVKLAAPEGFITIFLEEGSPVARLLSALLRGSDLAGEDAEHARNILDAYPEAVRVAGGPPAVSGSMLIEPLTSRELEILRLMNEGLTNREIADRLTITLHTVKKHSSNIYGKLDVSSRTQAAARGRELGLL